jgi:hypothetical protein
MRVDTYKLKKTFRFDLDFVYYNTRLIALVLGRPKRLSKLFRKMVLEKCSLCTDSLLPFVVQFENEQSNHA